MEELTTKRLAIIKLLYNIGLNQSYDSEPMNGFCILSFHDSVEMFMKLCTEEKNIKIEGKINFLDYFNKIPNLQCKVTMDNLNRKRVTLKHNGVLPSMLDIEISRVNVTEFFEENTPVFFNIQFSEISLVSIVKFKIVRSYLNDALKEIDNKNFADSIQYSHIAFKELFFAYEDNKLIRLQSPFRINNNFNIKDSYFRGIGLNREFNEFIHEIENAIKNINSIVEVLGFGIDYKKYIKFKLFAPDINVWHEKSGREYEAINNEKIVANKRNAQFCFDFVIESALKVQNVDFDVNELLK